MTLRRKTVNSAAGVFPPLQSATGGALFILDEAKKFKENKKEWDDFGKYVADNVAEVVAAIKYYDASTEEAKLWVESATKLDGWAVFLPDSLEYSAHMRSHSVLQEIKCKVCGRLAKIEKRSTVRNAMSYLRDPGRIDGLKKDLDKALTSFQLRTNLVIGRELSSLRADSLLNQLPCPIAYHDPTKACLEGTRRYLIEHIMRWCHNMDDSTKRVMLLTAVAGAGKTSVAHSVAEECTQEGILLSIFFFRVGEQTRPDHLFSGIAKSLAKHDPDCRASIISALQKDPNLSTATFTEQFKKLVAKPIKTSPSDRPMVIIIDALDECNSEDKVFEHLADILRKEVPSLPSNIKFLVTSRQFGLVDRFFSLNYPIERLSINISDDANVQDCGIYVRAQLRELMDVHPNLKEELEGEDEDEMARHITGRAGGLFIWISTIFHYMKVANGDPMRMLKKLLNTGVHQSNVAAEEMMDRLYASILEKCNWKDGDFAHDYPIVMGAILVAQQPLSAAAWDAILSPFLTSPIRCTLTELAPLLSGVKDRHMPIRILHQSFRDFIVNRIDVNLCRYAVDATRENARVALRCTQILNQDLSSVEGLGLIESLTVRDVLPSIPPEKLSEHLHYACRHIVYHLCGVQEPTEMLNDSVRMFFNLQATRWVEVCVGMEGYIGISSLPEWATPTVDQRSTCAIHKLANMLTQLGLNLAFFTRMQEAHEAENDSVVLCRYFVSLDPETYTPDLARSLNNLYFSLSKLGRRSEALSSIKESVELQRQPGSHTPSLATSLNNLFHALSELGHHPEALSFIEESVELQRQLVTTRASCTPNLAASLNNLYSALSKLGQHSKALPIIEEGVKLCRQLVAVHSELFISDLAYRSTIYMTHFLTSGGILRRSHRSGKAFSFGASWLLFTQCHTSHHSEALPIIEESVKLCRQLVAVHPELYIPNLAGSLNNLFGVLSNLGRHSEALPPIEAAVKLRRQLVALHPESYTPDLAILQRQLAAVHPGSYTPDLANSLNHLFHALSKVGRHSEALSSIEEGVKLLRQLVAAHPESYTPDLAASLNNLYKALSGLGRHSEGLPFIENSVKLCPTSLSNLYDALSELGRHSEALPFIKESIGLRRQLAAVHPESHNPYLATSLNNLCRTLSDLGRHSEALSSIQESVELLRQLVIIHPGLHTPNLATSLSHLYNALSKLGRHSEALLFIDESVKLFRQLVAVQPESYTPDLAVSLNGLYKSFSKLGRHSDGLPFIGESVKLLYHLNAVHPGLYAPTLALSLNDLCDALSNIGWHSGALMIVTQAT
ncbi:uncharacterized protein EI90DRAFT_3118383 [Cantharellus anzutake]|uniref:uncharacterized protein n=1 Tax=Cantharellus anzutake TaxID=1750568 RepID=UPI001906B494|nr:uncharacterized protein EI90DRAFT_3118383 [Cantharellus anzutake]KAF8337928.1 hypothetical protein EI90DRAFT_3118383 [Cantharellus anzutake]